MDKIEIAQKRYEEALNQLRQHPSMIWTRNNFFLIVQSGLLAVVLKGDLNSDKTTICLVCFMGFYIALIWFWIVLAGQKLQRKWRSLVIRFEREYLGEEGGAFIQASKDIGEGTSLSVSITTALKLLAFGFVTIWLVLLVKELIL